MKVLATRLFLEPYSGLSESLGMMVLEIEEAMDAHSFSAILRTGGPIKMADEFRIRPFVSEEAGMLLADSPLHLIERSPGQWFLSTT